MADWKVFTPARTPDTDEIRSDGAIFVASGSGGGAAPVIGYAQAGSVSGLSGVTPTTTPCFTFGTKLPGYGGDTGRKLYIPETFTITLDSMTPGGTSVTMSPGWYQLVSVTPIGENPLTAIDPPEISYADFDVTGASYKAPFFDCMCFEEGTTACKLAVTNEAKTLIRNALINKGVDVPDTTPFRQYAGKVGEIGGSQIPESVGVKIRNIAPYEYDIYYFSNISGDGTLTIYLSYDDLVSFTILGGTPVAIKGYSWSAPMIWDNFHAKEITAMPINAPGTDEVYYVVDSGILFDDENGSISLEINSQSG